MDVHRPDKPKPHVDTKHAIDMVMTCFNVAQTTTKYKREENNMQSTIWQQSLNMHFVVYLLNILQHEIIDIDASKVKKVK